MHVPQNGILNRSIDVVAVVLLTRIVEKKKARENMHPYKLPTCTLNECRKCGKERHSKTAKEKKKTLIKVITWP
jgi:hypothetical protein